MPSKKKAAKKASSKKGAAKKATSRKAASKKSTARSASTSRSTQGGAGLASLLSKISLELEGGKTRKLSKADIARAQECLSKTGKILVSFKPARFDGGTGTGTGTQLID